jgi:hypothetical protein
MSDYTSTQAGFQRAMEWALTGPPDETKQYVEATVLPTFYHIMNGAKLEYDAYVKGIEEWRAKISDYKPKVLVKVFLFLTRALSAVEADTTSSTEFLRDGDQLAAHMSGTIKIEGADFVFESFMFATVDTKTGKLAVLTERAIWEPAGNELK